jgi:hypothetical protein
MAAILAGPTRLVNADGVRLRRAMRREDGRRESAAGPRNEAPQMKGKGPSVSLVSEVSGFLSPE